MTPRMAEMAVFGMFFEHLFISVNGVGKRAQSSRDLLPVIAVLSLILGSLSPKIPASSVTFCDIG
jgi:hypothetical protein